MSSHPHHRLVIRTCGLSIALFAGTAWAQQSASPPPPSGPPPASSDAPSASPEPSVSSSAPSDAPSSAPTDAATAAPSDSPSVSSEAPAEALDEVPAIRTGIAGTVIDAASGEPIIDAPVTVIGSTRRVVTDVDGHFAIALPPGRYTLRTYYSLYRPARLENLEVRDGVVTRASFRLESATAAARTQEVVVTARADTSTAATQVEVRRRAATVSDAISAEEISRSPDVTASDSIRRIVGASLVDGQYAYVRGLGGRYVNTLLNGVPLPGSDPDRPGVQLDLFPAALLDNMTLVKTFTADLPGDFAGGSLQINTRAFPNRFFFTANVSLGGDSLTHTGNVLRGRSGAFDMLALDDGGRALPSQVPAHRVQLGRDGLGADDLTRIGRSFPNNWRIAAATPVPNLGLNVTLGDTLRRGSQAFGYLVSLGYGFNEQRIDSVIRSVRVDAGTGSSSHLGVREELHQEGTVNNALWGLLGTATYRPAPHHEIGLVMMWNQTASDTVSTRTGYNETAGSDMFSRQLRYVQRSLFFSQLTGDHRALPLDVRFRWQLYGSYVARYEPDTRQLNYLAEGDSFRVVTGPGNVGRFYGDLRQFEGGGGADLEIPSRYITGRAGVLVRLSDRTFSTRRFSYRDIGSTSDQQLEGPEQFFAPDRIGDTLEIAEYTQPADGYRAIQQSFAPYLRGDIPLGPVRLVGGVRLESFRQWVSSKSPFSTMTNGTAARTDRTDLNVLPSASMVWSPNARMNVRLAYGGTVARPLVRELAPFLFEDFVRNRTVQGNPALRSTFIHNVDVRWEMFPGGSDVIAASVFYKEFLDPIEQVILDRNGNVTFDNVQGARNFGGELEARVGLGRLTNALSPFVVGANLALIYSQVTLSPEQQLNATNETRPLAGQSPYVANVMAGYAPANLPVSMFVYYNVFGSRVEDVGRFGLPDVYQRELHQLDAVATWSPVPHVSLRVAARNLLFQGATLEQGGIVVQQVRPATSVSLRVAISY